ncbi:MAG: hypothetical protein ABR954_02220 [Dehalococcoidales bacterium]
MPIKVIAVAVPEYTVKEKPDYLKIGRKVDAVIEKNFSDRKYIYRAIGIDDHPGLTLDELVSIILKSGTDRYNPNRKGVCHDQFSVYNYDIQAGSFEIKNQKIVIEETDTYPTLFGDTIYDFFENAPQDRGHPVRIDILVLYDTNKLELAKLKNPELEEVVPRLEKYLYKFRERDNKRDALLGIVKILR